MKKIWFYHRIDLLVVFFCLCVGFISVPAFAEYQLTTKDGAKLKWESFSLEDGDYCTWQNNGKFCLPANNIVSVKEVHGSSSSGGGTAQPSAKSSSSGRNTESVGTMQRNYNSGNVSGRSSYPTRGGGSAYHDYDVNGTSTTYSRSVDEQDIRRLEAEEATRRMAAEDRRLEREQQERADRAQAEIRHNQEKRDGEFERLKREAERNARWGRW